MAAAVYNGKFLYIGGLATTIKGKEYRGSVQERNPSDGILQMGEPVCRTPSSAVRAWMAGGVIAAGTYDSSKSPNATYLINATSGKVIRNLIEGTDFAQSAFAGGWLFTANAIGVYAWGLGRG